VEQPLHTPDGSPFCDSLQHSRLHRQVVAISNDTDEAEGLVLLREVNRQDTEVAKPRMGFNQLSDLGDLGGLAVQSEARRVNCWLQNAAQTPFPSTLDVRADLVRTKKGKRKQ
jgi:hypothetical protein